HCRKVHRDRDNGPTRVHVQYPRRPSQLRSIQQRVPTRRLQSSIPLDTEDWRRRIRGMELRIHDRSIGAETVSVAPSPFTSAEWSVYTQGRTPDLAVRQATRFAAVARGKR